MVITDQEYADLREIQRLLDEAYDNYFAKGDGHCKSMEGSISIEFNNYFDRHGGDPFNVRSVGVYSYVLGPSRSHYFDSTAEALAAVRKWHADEMARDYDEDWTDYIDDEDHD